MFVDTIDFVLGNGSPAIDAGPNNPFVVDIDGTISDMGIYGGPTPFDQFDDQRDAMRTAPFTYPLFNVTEAIDVTGNIQVEVISIARQR